MYNYDFTFSPKATKAREIAWFHYSDGLKKASSENKLALLVISAAWCYWCHVMDETTFSDEEMIRTLNSEVVAIRADSDLEPEIEARYAGNGLPAVSILSPHGITLGSGNFFTKEELKALINEAKNFYATQRKFYFEKKDELERKIEEIRNKAAESSAHIEPEDLVREVILQAVLNLDHEEVGFGTDGKFPHPEMLRFLFSFSEYEGENELFEMPLQILKTALTTLFDEKEGGFFRYARNRDWTDPQTDKHIYDNSMILEAIADAYRISGDDAFKEAANATVRFIEANLKISEGLYGFCQDANDEYYIMRDENSSRSLEKPRFVLEPVSAYNLRYASALIRASEAFKNSDYLEVAAKIVQAHLNEPLFDSQKNLLRRSKEKRGYLLQDSVELINALAMLWRSLKDKYYLDLASKVYNSVKEHFFDKRKGLFRDRASEPDDIGALNIAYHPLNENCLLASSIYQLILNGALDKGEKEVSESVLRAFSKEIEELGPFSAPIGLAALASLQFKEAN